MGLNVANCPRCGRVYAKGIRDICPACVREIDEQYDRCVLYLRGNGGATIRDVSESTGVTIKQITKFIKEGRISLVNAPNLAYPCDVCGLLIREGTMCDACRKRLNKDVNMIREEEERRRRAELERQKAMTYHAFDRKKT